MKELCLNLSHQQQNVTYIVRIPNGIASCLHIACCGAHLCVPWTSCSLLRYDALGIRLWCHPRFCGVSFSGLGEDIHCLVNMSTSVVQPTTRDGEVFFDQLRLPFMLKTAGVMAGKIDSGVSKNGGTPKWMVYNGIPIKMDDLGVPLFLETPI